MWHSILRPVAWLAILFILVVTVSPIELRPGDMISTNIDRALAFFATGLLFVLAYPRHARSVTLALVAAAYLIEAFQLIQPTRHPELLDATIKAGGALLGALAGRILIGLARR